MLKIKLQENKENTANLYFKGRNIRRLSRIAPSVIDITWKNNSERKRVEKFIKDVYSESYGAKIDVEYPVLMSVRNKEGDILAAVGFRFAEQEDLFLEQYTSSPIDRVLNVPRSKIVEVGNLASAGGGASIFLFAALSSYLNNKNIEHAVVTGTSELHRMFKKMGLTPKTICDADVELLEDNNEDWGSYYDTAPRVLVGSISKGFERLQKVLGAEFEDCRTQMASRLHYK